MSNTSLVIDPRDRATLQDCRLTDLLMTRILAPGESTPTVEELNEPHCRVSTPDVDAERERWDRDNEGDRFE